VNKEKVARSWPLKMGFTCAANDRKKEVRASGGWHDHAGEKTERRGRGLEKAQ